MSFQSDDSNAEYGIIEDIDEDNYLAKVKLFPSQHLTGFLPIATMAHGFLCMPSKGTLVKVLFMLNNRNAGVITTCFYEKENAPNKPPPATASKPTLPNMQTTQAKEKWHIHKHPYSGAEIHFTDTGEYKIFTPEGIIIECSKDYHLKSTTKIYFTSPEAELDCETVKLGNANINNLVRKDFIDNVYTPFMTAFQTALSASLAGSVDPGHIAFGAAMTAIFATQSSSISLPGITTSQTKAG